jgi:hypothetical protein
MMLQHHAHVQRDATENAVKAQAIKKGKYQLPDSMVELSGIEPLTSSLRTRRSPS